LALTLGPSLRGDLEVKLRLEAGEVCLLADRDDDGVTRHGLFRASDENRRTASPSVRWTEVDPLDNETRDVVGTHHPHGCLLEYESDAFVLRTFDLLVVSGHLGATAPIDQAHIAAMAKPKGASDRVHGYISTAHDDDMASQLDRFPAVEPA
jgi:hypothetical protein